MTIVMEANGALIALYTFATPVNVRPSITPISIIFEKQQPRGMGAVTRKKGI
jgi:hypothetical protein